jgi:hypothetical protein
MKYDHKKTIFLIAACCLSFPCFSTNYDDGIAADGPIQDNMTKDTNIEFIIQKATAGRKSGSSKGRNVGIGNIIIEAGAVVNGDIINASENDNSSVISK